jgi:hypothetical protein
MPPSRGQNSRTSSTTASAQPEPPALRVVASPSWQPSRELTRAVAELLLDVARRRVAARKGRLTECVLKREPPRG